MTKITLQVERRKLILKLRTVLGGPFLPASSSSLRSLPKFTLNSAQSTSPLEELPTEDTLRRSANKAAAGQIFTSGHGLFNSELENLINRDSERLFNPMTSEYNASMLPGDACSSDSFICLDTILEQIQVGLYTNPSHNLHVLFPIAT